MSKMRKLACICLIILLPSLVMASPRKGEKAPDFRSVTVTGGEVSLSSLAGSVVILDFFATWCAPCRSSTKHLVRLQRKYGKTGLHVIGMSIDAPSSEILRRYISEKEINYPVLNAGEELESEYAVHSLPTLFIIDRDGRIAAQFNGFNHSIADSLERLVSSLLQQPGAAAK